MASPVVPRRSRRWRGGRSRERGGRRPALNSDANAITIRKSESGKLRLVTLTRPCGADFFRQHRSIAGRSDAVMIGTSSMEALPLTIAHRRGGRWRRTTNLGVRSSNLFGRAKQAILLRSYLGAGAILSSVKDYIRTISAKGLRELRLPGLPIAACQASRDFPPAGNVVRLKRSQQYAW